MYNASEIKAHNHYHYQLIDKDGTIIKEDTVYNTANSGLFVAEAGNSKMSGAPVNIMYNPIYRNDQEEIVESDKIFIVRDNVPLARVNSADSIEYGTTVTYVGALDFPAGGFNGKLISIGLGGPYIKGEDEENREYIYWSEAGLSGTKSESISLHIDVTIMISASMPSMSRPYDASISSVLHRDSAGLLTPGAGWIGLSSLGIGQLPNPLKKRIPVKIKLPITYEADRDGGSFTTRNPKNAIDPSEDGYMIMGKDYNYGYLPTIVFDDIGANNMGGGARSVYIPAVILTAEEIRRLNTQMQNSSNDNEMAWFFCSIPQGATYHGIRVNGVDGGSGGFIWKEPNGVGGPQRLTPTGYSMSDADYGQGIGQFHNTETGQYYASNIWGGYWEPPSGSPVSPDYVFFNNAPQNVYAGYGAGAIIDAWVDGHWERMGSSTPCAVTYFEPIEGATRYRALISVPDETGDFFVNSAEKTVLSHKAYDPNILCIGDANNDFGKCGIGINKTKMADLYKGIFTDQKYSGYNIGVVVDVSGGFYKNSNIVAKLRYGVTASGS